MELFVRKVNLRLYKRSWAELTSVSAPERRALVNRAAFRTLTNAASSCVAFSEKMAFISDHENVKVSELALLGANLLSEGERGEVIELATRMCSHLFRLEHARVVLNPAFAGCGIINACRGDAFSAPSNIIELKDGDRAFRAYEFRQLTVYAALHLNSTGELPSSIEVVNSRRGVSVRMSMADFAGEVAGQSAHDYLSEVIRVISDITLSR